MKQKPMIQHPMKVQQVANMEYQSLLIKIKKELSILGIVASLDNIPSLPDVSIIINSYSPDDNKRPISLAFSINENPIQFKFKCWLTENNLKEINGRYLQPHDDYQKFDYKKKIFYPFSVNLSDYQVDSNSIKILCSQIYKHIKYMELSDITSMRDVSQFKTTDDVDKYLEELRG